MCAKKCAIRQTCYQSHFYRPTNVTIKLPCYTVHVWNNDINSELFQILNTGLTSNLRLTFHRTRFEWQSCVQVVCTVHKSNVTHLLIKYPKYINIYTNIKGKQSSTLFAYFVTNLVGCITSCNCPTWKARFFSKISHISCYKKN